jgi:hypothetical protein
MKSTPITGTQRPPDLKALAAAAAKLGQGVTVQEKGGTLNVLVELGGGRTQLIAITSREDSGASVGRVTTKIGPASNLTGQRPLALLRMNASLRSGAFAVDGDSLVLIDTFLPAHTTAQELLNILLYAAKTADQQEKNLGKDDH